MCDQSLDGRTTLLDRLEDPLIVLLYKRRVSPGVDRVSSLEQIGSYGQLGLGGTTKRELD